MLKKLKNTNGFSLSELSVVLAIIGTILGGSISVVLYQTESIKEEQTLKKMKIIEEAIASFVALNRRLPCPADGSLDINTAGSVTYGQEAMVANVCNGNYSYTVSTNLPSTTPAISNADIITGAVPVVSLRLPKEVMLDGWGRKFTYVVSRGLSSNSTTSPFDSEEDGVIKIKNFTNPAGANYVTNRAAYVILSHGKSGAGGWKSNGGTRLSSGTDTKKVENSHTSGAINEVFVLNISNNSANTFDDIIKYKNKEQISLEINTILSGQVCDDAVTALNDSNQTVLTAKLCGGTGGTGKIASNPDCAIYLASFGELIRKRCIQR
ncbi:MAG: type II secretion system protein [Sphingobacteriia bacterium]|nr:type II secretion system protein [Sphingobacteriia bacterium]